jgi:hypothetical protein
MKNQNNALLIVLTLFIVIVCMISSRKIENNKNELSKLSTELSDKIKEITKYTELECQDIWAKQYFHKVKLEDIISLKMVKEYKYEKTNLLDDYGNVIDTTNYRREYNYIVPSFKKSLYSWVDRVKVKKEGVK